MAQNIDPVFALKPNTPGQIITATTTDKSGATLTNVKTLVTAAADGTKVTRIKAKHVGNSAAGLLLVWITDTSGLNPILSYEVAYSAVTSSTTVATAEAEIILNDLQLKSGQLILVGATVVSSNIHVHASLGDFS